MKWNTNEEAYPAIINLLKKSNQDNYVICHNMKYS